MDNCEHVKPKIVALKPFAFISGFREDELVGYFAWCRVYTCLKCGEKVTEKIDENE